MDFSLTVLGCSAATPANGLHPSAQFLSIRQQHYLIDCGEGTQMRLLHFGISPSKLSCIFISHLHGDHYFGLVGLLTSLALGKRKEPLHIFSPLGLEQIVRAQVWQQTEDAEAFSLIFHIVDTEQHCLIYENDSVEVFSIPLRHRISTSGYLFKEKPQPLNILTAAIEKYNLDIPTIIKIKAGSGLTLPDGKVVPNVMLTAPRISPRTYAYCSDTTYFPELANFVRGVDLLYHEATFLQQDEEKATQRAHSTALQAAQTASNASAKALLLGHFSARYKSLELFSQEAASIFPKVSLAREGTTYEIAYDDRRNKLISATPK